MFDEFHRVFDVFWFDFPGPGSYTRPKLSYMRPMLRYIRPMLSNTRLMLSYTRPMLAYWRPMLSYIRPMLSHIRLTTQTCWVHRTLGTYQNSRDLLHGKAQTLSKH